MFFFSAKVSVLGLVPTWLFLLVAEGGGSSSVLGRGLLIVAASLL